MDKDKYITKGFTATKGNTIKEIRVEVHSLGFYISTYTDLRIDNTVPRSTIKRAKAYVEEYRQTLIKKKYTITEGEKNHRVIYDPKTFQFRTSI